MYIPQNTLSPQKSYTHCIFLLASIIIICKDELSEATRQSAQGKT